MKYKVGVIGGLGPETTSEFYMDLVRKSRKNCDFYPRIIIDSLSFPFSLEEEIIFKSRNEDKLLPVLKDGIKRLNKAGVDFIVIPCNTVHVFIEELRRKSKVPVLSIIEETIDTIKRRGHKKIGLLATNKTIDSKLYEIPLTKNGIDVLKPEDQDEVARIILKILENKLTQQDKKKLVEIANKLIERGAECIVLGCTDLQIVIKKNDVKVDILDSMENLSNSTFEKIQEI